MASAIFLFFYFCSSLIQAQRMNQNDGPYIFYQDGWVIVHSIGSSNDTSVSKVDSFPVSEKNRHPLSIHFSNHSGWDFTVPFKKISGLNPANGITPPPSSLFRILKESLKHSGIYLLPTRSWTVPATGPLAKVIL